MEIDRARELAWQVVEPLSTGEVPLALLPDDTVQDHGWCYVFLWNTARYAETRDLADSIGPGYGPVVVVKDTGDTWMMGSHRPPDELLSLYAIEHGIKS